MALPVMVNMSGSQFGYHGPMDAQLYPREDFAMEVEPFWDPSALDPSLRDIDNPMAFFPEWDDESGQSWPQFFGESSNMMPFQVQSLQKTLNRPYEATGPIPRAFEATRGSPTASICSSATSPGVDREWFPDSCQHPSRMESYTPSQSASYAQGLPELAWEMNSMPSTGLIHMSVVQGIPDEVQGIPNPQDVALNADEFEMEGDSRMNFSMEAESQPVRSEETREQYGRSSDGGTRVSRKNEASSETHRSEPAMTTDTEGDLDAEGEDFNEFDESMNGVEEPVEEEDRDTEYKPKGSRNKRRRSSRASSSSSPSNKKHKVIKASSRKSQHQCKTCEHYAKDAMSLTRHVAAAHTRPYICSFSFAGCGATFGNKNEWKRHVSSQHLCLQSWVCSEGACPSSKLNPSGRDAHSSRLKPVSNLFNRKDLFTQHLKRMHEPHNAKQGKKSTEWNDRIKELQLSCLVIRRDPPSKTKCPVRQCGQIFEGLASWDERMEHVGRHLEKSAITAHGDAGSNAIEQEGDEFLILWALKERIIERKGSSYKFCNFGEPVDEEDSDAEGEAE